MNKPSNQHTCWVCKSQEMSLYRESKLRLPVESKDFLISDSRYGLTGKLEKCQQCGFIQCNEILDAAQYYKGLEDTAYEMGREQRKKQAGKILDQVMRTIKMNPAGLKLIDVGAGSGILIEAAKARTIEADGIEPSHWLCRIAQERGLRVIEGVLPHPEIQPQYQVATLIDVLEHVNNPSQLLLSAVDSLESRQGYVVIATPDIDSWVSRIMGSKWWHFRIAHIGYYNLKTLRRLLGNVGLEIVAVSRPSWEFSLDYMLERVLRYTPFKIQAIGSKWLKRINLPFNFFDSLLIVAKTKSTYGLSLKNDRSDGGNS